MIKDKFEARRQTETDCANRIEGIVKLDRWKGKRDRDRSAVRQDNEMGKETDRANTKSDGETRQKDRETTQIQTVLTDRLGDS